MRDHHASPDTKFSPPWSEWTESGRQNGVLFRRSRRVDGPCRTDEFREVSLVSVPYKALCRIVQRRMMEVVEERGLVAEEQGGFTRGRGCRDQVLTLLLLGQVKAQSRSYGWSVKRYR